MRIKDLFEKYSDKGASVTLIKVPLGVNPFRDLWDALMRKAEKRLRARGKRA